MNREQLFRYFFIGVFLFLGFQILHILSACRGAMDGLMAEVIEDHIQSHIVDPSRKPTSEQTKAAQDLIDVIKSYLK